MGGCAAGERVMGCNQTVGIAFRNPDSFHETDLRPGIHSQWMRCQWLGDRLLPVGQQRPIREEGVG